MIGWKFSKTFKFVNFVSGSSEIDLYFPPQEKVLPSFTSRPEVSIPFLLSSLKKFFEKSFPTTDTILGSDLKQAANEK